MHVDAHVVLVTVRKMTADETTTFLTTGTRTGKLAWVGRDGRPHVAPIWFVLDGDDLIFNTHESSGKAKALRREGRASLVVDDQAPPYSFVKIDGTISFDDDPGTVRRVATEIGGRYMGDDRAEEYGARNGVPGELVVRLTPTRVVAQADISD
jgi:PPOX class probable F420-dependent enzyme